MINDGYSKEIELKSGKKVAVRRPNGKNVAPIVGLGIGNEIGVEVVGKNIDLICLFVNSHVTEIDGKKPLLKDVENLDYNDILELLGLITAYHFEKGDAEKN